MSRANFGFGEGRQFFERSKASADDVEKCRKVLCGDDRPEMSDQLIDLLGKEAYKNAVTSILEKTTPAGCSQCGSCRSSCCGRKKKGRSGLNINWCAMLGLGGNSHKVGKRRRGRRY